MSTSQPSFLSKPHPASLPLHSLELNPPTEEATQPQSSLGPHGTATYAVQPEPDRIKEVIEEAIEVDRKFVTLLIHTKLEFSKKSEDFLGKLRTTLVTLPVSRMFKHLCFLTSESEHIMNAKSVDEIFKILDKYWNYTNYTLLQYLVQEFGESTLKEEMCNYVAVLENFEKKTTILESNIAARNQRYPQKCLWGHFEFSRVIVKLPRDPAVCTLYEVRQLAENMVKRSCLEPYTWSQEVHQPRSVNVTLLFPRAALELIVSALDEEFLTMYQIITVTIDHKLLKQYNEDYVKVCVSSEVYIHRYLHCILAAISHKISFLSLSLM